MVRRSIRMSVALAPGRDRPGLRWESRSPRRRWRRRPPPCSPGRHRFGAADSSARSLALQAWRTPRPRRIPHYHGRTGAPAGVPHRRAEQATDADLAALTNDKLRIIDGLPTQPGGAEPGPRRALSTTPTTSSVRCRRSRWSRWDRRRACSGSSRVARRAPVLPRVHHLPGREPGIRRRHPRHHRHRQRRGAVPLLGRAGPPAGNRWCSCDPGGRPAHGDLRLPAVEPLPQQPDAVSLDEINGAFDQLQQTYGSFDNYVHQGLKLTNGDVAALRAKMLS